MKKSLEPFPINDINGVDWLFTDTLINSEVLLNQGENLEKDIFKGGYLAKVLWHTVDMNGYVIGHHHEDPQFNTVLYEVEFDNGKTRPYAAKVIANNIYWKVDQFGRRDLIFLRDYWPQERQQMIRCEERWSIHYYK